MIKTCIIYATLGGNTELAVKRVQEELITKNFEVLIQRVDVAKTQDLENYDLIIFASPTYGQGTVEQHFEKFLKDFGIADWSHKKFAVIGLGDTKYYPEYLTESAGILEEKITKVNGNLIVPALRIGMPPLKFINKLVPAWTNKIATVYTA
jgi:flavodoxin I